MTDSPDFILARIGELQATIALNDLYIQIAIAVLISSLALCITLLIWEYWKGGFESDLATDVGSISFVVLVMAVLAWATLAYDNFTMQVTLDQLIAQYEAIYGPLEAWCRWRWPP